MWTEDGDLLSLRIDGSQVTVDAIDCAGEVIDGSEGAGELDESGTAIVWTTNPGDEGASSQVVLTDSAISIDGETTLYLEGTDQGDQVRATYQEDCAEIF